MNITKLTEKYISEHPSIKDCLQKDLVNFSELSRQICDELKIDKFDAVLIACRRYLSKIKNEAGREKEIRALMKDVKLRVRNKIMVAIIEKPRDMESFYLLQKKIKKQKGDFNIIEGEDSVTIITNSHYLEDIKSFRHRVIRITKDVVQISMIFNEKIETTAGVVSYVFSLLAENGINILEEMSCWTDLMIIIEEKDLGKAMKVMSF